MTFCIGHKLTEFSVDQIAQPLAINYKLPSMHTPYLKPLIRHPRWALALWPTEYSVKLYTTIFVMFEHQPQKFCAKYISALNRATSNLATIWDIIDDGKKVSEFFDLPRMSLMRMQSCEKRLSILMKTSNTYWNSWTLSIQILEKLTRTFKTLTCCHWVQYCHYIQKMVKSSQMAG